MYSESSSSSWRYRRGKVTKTEYLLNPSSSSQNTPSVGPRRTSPTFWSTCPTSSSCTTSPSTPGRAERRPKPYILCLSPDLAAEDNLDNPLLPLGSSWPSPASKYTSPSSPTSSTSLRTSQRRRQPQYLWHHERRLEHDNLVKTTLNSGRKCAFYQPLPPTACSGCLPTTRRSKAARTCLLCLIAVSEGATKKTKQENDIDKTWIRDPVILALSATTYESLKMPTMMYQNTNSNKYQYIW